MNPKLIALFVLLFLDIGFIPRFSQYDMANKIFAIISFLGTAVIIFLIVAEKRKKKEEGEFFSEEIAFQRNRIIKLIDNGLLSPVESHSVILQKGEDAFCELPGSLNITKNKVIGTSGGNGGVSVRVAKGVYVHSGSSASKKIYGDVTTTYNGTLVVTSRRIVFLNPEKGFEIPFSKITGLYSTFDTLFLQQGNKSYVISVYNSDIIERLIRKLTNK